MLIDPSSPIGLIRLRIGDTRDIQVLPDDVIQSALAEKNGNLKAAAILCASYILASLAFDSQAQMGVITVYGNQVFQQYRDYLMMVVKDPSFSSISPIPYGGSGEEAPLVRFTKDWHLMERNYFGPGGFVRVYDTY